MYNVGDKVMFTEEYISAMKKINKKTDIWYFIYHEYYNFVIENCDKIVTITDNDKAPKYRLNGTRWLISDDHMKRV